MFSVILYTHKAFEHPIHRFALETLVQNAYKAPEQPQVIIVAGCYISGLPGTVQQIQHGKAQNISSHLDIANRLFLGLLHAKHEQVFICEHDVLYPEGYFCQQRVKSGAILYNRNLYVLNEKGFYKSQRTVTSNACGHKSDLRAIYEKRIFDLKNAEPDEKVIKWSEPGKNHLDPIKGWLLYESKNPVIDTRLAGNFTGPRNAQDASQYKDVIEYWPTHRELLQCLTFASCPACFEKTKNCICKKEK